MSLLPLCAHECMLPAGASCSQCQFLSKAHCNRKKRGLINRLLKCSGFVHAVGGAPHLLP
eukprot:1162018-Pelagomonas_calceolata.AAC.15